MAEKKNQWSNTWNRNFPKWNTEEKNVLKTKSISVPMGQIKWNKIHLIKSTERKGQMRAEDKKKKIEETMAPNLKVKPTGPKTLNN